MRSTVTSVLQSYRPWEGALGLTLKGANLRDVSPGQCLLLHLHSSGNDIFALPAWPSARNEHDDTLDVLVHNVSERPVVLPAGLDQVDVALLGPVGRGFLHDQKTRRAVLVDGGSLLAPLHFLARVLLAQGVEVTYLAASRVSISNIAVALPPEVEFRTLKQHSAAMYDDALASALGPLISWADAMYLSLEAWQAPMVISILRRQLLRLRSGFAQVLLTPALLPCGVGACDLCSIRMRDGYRRVCRDGLVFDLLKFL